MHLYNLPFFFIEFIQDLHRNNGLRPFINGFVNTTEGTLNTIFPIKQNELKKVPNMRDMCILTKT